MLLRQDGWVRRRSDCCAERRHRHHHRTAGVQAERVCVLVICACGHVCMWVCVRACVCLLVVACVRAAGIDIVLCNMQAQTSPALARSVRWMVVFTELDGMLQHEMRTSVEADNRRGCSRETALHGGALLVADVWDVRCGCNNATLQVCAHDC